MYGYSKDRLPLSRIKGTNWAKDRNGNRKRIGGTGRVVKE